MLQSFWIFRTFHHQYLIFFCWFPLYLGRRTVSLKHIKVVTFNIRLDCKWDGENNFEFRQPLILKTLRKECPDIVCFQEVLPHVQTWLKESLPEYTVVGCGREPGLRGESVCIAFRANLFSVIHMDTFWLSPEPFTPGSRYAEQSDCPRTAVELLLHLDGTEQVLRILNTHLDHQGTLARSLGLQQILRHLDHAPLFPDAPVILTGDLNAPPESPEISVFRAYPEYRNATEGIGMTYHGYMKGTPGSIDYIFLRGPISCLKTEKWMDCENGVYLSDHYPVCAHLELLPTMHQSNAV